MCEGTLEVPSYPCQQEQAAPMPVLVPLFLDSCPGWRSHRPPGKHASRSGHHPGDLHCSVPGAAWSPHPSFCPAAATGSCLFSSWCLILPQAKCQIVGQSHDYHPAMKESESLDRVPKENLKNKLQLSSLGIHVIIFTCYCKQNFLIAWVYSKCM